MDACKRYKFRASHLYLGGLLNIVPSRYIDWVERCVGAEEDLFFCQMASPSCMDSGSQWGVGERSLYSPILFGEGTLIGRSPPSGLACSEGC